MAEVAKAGDDNAVDADFFNRGKHGAVDAEMNVDECDEATSKVREGKISLKLFDKKKGKKGEAKKVDTQMADEDSVDMDFLATEGSAAVSKAEKPLSPQLFKPSKRRKRGAAAGKAKAKSTKLSYDSDSLDVDALSSLAAKSFGAGPSSEMSPNFTALMKKPLAENYCGKSTRSDTKAAGEDACNESDNEDAPLHPPHTQIRRAGKEG